MHNYLYCPNIGCEAYLGSLGRNSCNLCGWRFGVHLESFQTSTNLFDPRDEEYLWDERMNNVYSFM